VRMLSDSPSLDDLRRQAKDLLVGLRETRPGAALTDAQTALARNYGFRSWPELKIEVERRRGRTDIADATLAGTIANPLRTRRSHCPDALASADQRGRSAMDARKRYRSTMVVWWRRTVSDGGFIPATAAPFRPWESDSQPSIRVRSPRRSRVEPNV